MTDNIAISIKNIDFAYDKKKIYNDFSLDICNNDLFFVMGINGCGKTTLLKIICSFLTISKGQVIVNGKDLKSYDTKDFAKTVAYVPQTINLASDFLVKDYLAMGRTPYKGFCESINTADYHKVEQYSEKLGITDLLGMNFNSLSGGQKQTVAICRSLIQETPIIVMDEPMSALDFGKQAEFLSIILSLKQEGKTVVLTTHNPNHALTLQKQCKVCFLTDGKILGVGLPNDVITNENIRFVYGEKVLMDDHSEFVRFSK